MTWILSWEISGDYTYKFKTKLPKSFLKPYFYRLGGDDDAYLLGFVRKSWESVDESTL